MLTPDQLDPELRQRSRADERTPLELGLTRILGHQPEMAKGLGQFTASLKANRTLPERLIELVRLRIAFHNQCRSCMAIRYPEALADGLTEDLVCSLERPMESEDLDDRERLAIRYGELFATNHLAIDDEFYDRMREHVHGTGDRRARAQRGAVRRGGSTVSHVGHGGGAARPVPCAGRGDAVGRRRRGHRALAA